MEAAAPTWKDILDDYPPLWTSPVDLWFDGVEKVFEIHEITDDKIKHEYLLKSLDEDSLKRVQDHVMKPPVKNQYQSLKTLLLTRVPEARKLQICRSILDLQLDSQKPSQLLRTMLNMAEDVVDQDFVRTAFAQCLPLKVQAIVENCKMLSLPEVGHLADHVVEYILENTADARFGERLHTLENKLAVLSTTLEKYANAFEKFTKKPKRKNKSSRDSAPAKSLDSVLNVSIETGACYYHQPKTPILPSRTFPPQTPPVQTIFRAAPVRKTDRKSAQYSTKCPGVAGFINYIN